MEISIGKFFALTALLAGTSVGVACSSDNEPGGGGAGRSGAGGNNASGGLGTGGLGRGGLGTGGLGSGRAPGDKAGLTGGESTGGGGTGRPAGGSGSELPRVSGGGGTERIGGTGAASGTGAGAGFGGAPIPTGGKMGGTPMGGVVGIGGTSGVGNSSGTGGTTGIGGHGSGGALGACLGGDPISEGGIDCSVLPYASEQCSGNSLPRGMADCIKINNISVFLRQDAADVILSCLKGLKAGTAGYCGDAHRAEADACVLQNLDRGCASSATTAACGTIHTACAAVDVAACSHELGALGANAVSTVTACFEKKKMPGLPCDQVYAECSGIPRRVLSAEEFCTEYRSSCPALDMAACTSALKANGGVLNDDYFIKGSAKDCLQHMQTESGKTCEEAFGTCIGGE